MTKTSALRCRPFAAGLLTVAAISCGVPTPSARCQADHSLVIDIQFLGEYQTDLATATLTQSKSHTVVWRIVGEGGLQVHRLVFRLKQPAAEPVQPAHGNVVVVVPSEPGLDLALDETYDLSLKAGKWSPARHVLFSLGQCQG